MATSDSIETGGPVFPHTRVHADTSGRIHDGMTLRDYFAAQALSGIIACPNGGGSSFESLAGYAYKYADAMLKAREVKHV